MIYGVVLAGGKGERFWPLSRANRPKQFLKLTSDKTMLEETIERVLPLIPKENILIVTGEDMCPLISDSIDYLDKDNVLGEPRGRNTSVAIGLAAVHLQRQDPQAVMVVLSADHLVRPAEKLLNIIRVGADIAAVEDRLVTIGIVPTRAETGYGYIQMGDVYRQQEGHVVYEVAAFTEKPKPAVASEYFYSHKYLWNSGMFLWSAESILKAIKRCQPVLHGELMKYAETIDTPGEPQARIELYERVESLSIDIAVLEQADNVLTIKGDIIWDDIGGWRALERYKSMDRDNNVLVGETVVLDTFETTVYNDREGIIACLGVSDLVVVRSDNITLVVHKTQVDRIKDLLAKISEDEKTKHYS